MHLEKIIMIFVMVERIILLNTNYYKTYTIVRLLSFYMNQLRLLV